MKKKLVAIIEKGPDKGFAVTASVPGLIGSGLTEEEARADFTAIVEEQAEYYVRRHGQIPWWAGAEVEFRYDQSSAQQRPSMRQVLGDIMVAVNWGDIAHRYFGRSAAWFYQKRNGHDVNGRPAAFTPEEKEQLRGALCDLSERIRRAAEAID